MIKWVSAYETTFNCLQNEVLSIDTACRDHSQKLRYILHSHVPPTRPFWDPFGGPPTVHMRLLAKTLGVFHRFAIRGTRWWGPFFKLLTTYPTPQYQLLKRARKALLIKSEWQQRRSAFEMAAAALTAQIRKCCMCDL